MKNSYYGYSDFAYPTYSNNYNLSGNSASSNYNMNHDDRFIGGFAFPFLLGGVTGAAIAPAFWRPPYNRPYYGGYYGPGPFYGPYRPF